MYAYRNSLLFDGYFSSDSLLSYLEQGGLVNNLDMVIRSLDEEVFTALTAHCTVDFGQTIRLTWERADGGKLLVSCGRTVRVNKISPTGNLSQLLEEAPISAKSMIDINHYLTNFLAGVISPLKINMAKHLTLEI